MDKIVEHPVELKHTVSEHIHKDPVGAKIGMWLFLLTELLLFGGMFIIYGIYRYLNSDAFHIAARELNTSVGTLNTVILLTSSLTVAMSITAIQKKNKTLSLILIGLTIIFAFAFLINKYFEWATKFHHGIYPADRNYPTGRMVRFYSSVYILL